MSRPPKPTAIAPLFDNIPSELRAIPRWICWRYMWHTKREKWIKAPVTPTNLKQLARVDKPATWSDFDTARGAYEMLGGVDGLGFVFTGDGIIGMDFDKCLDRETGEISDTAKEAVNRISGFWELSPSGNGLHCFTLASIDKSHKDDSKGLEMYDRGRYFTVTGHVFDGMDDVPDAPQNLDWFVAKHFPAKTATTTRKAVVAEAPDPLEPVDFFRSVNDAAMKNFASWVPVLFPEATEHGDGYRITSASIGRDLEEDIAIHPSGIKDFGQHDQEGEEREGKRSPVDLVMEWYSDQLAGGDVLKTPDVQRAALWLCQQMDVDPKTLGFQPPARRESEQAAGLELAFERDDNDRPLATVGNVLLACRAEKFLGARIAYDAFRDELMIARDGTQEWRAFTDPDYVRLRWVLEEQGFRPIGRELMRDVAMLVADDNKFDSAILWLESLPPWDGVPRIERFLIDYMGCEDTPYHRAVAMYLWTAMAGRVMEPGVKADMAVILSGPQGIGKSSGVAALVPHQEHFAEINLVDKDDDLARKMRGRLVGEIGELRGLNSRDLEGIKSFISRTHEDWTPKYKEFNQKFARRLVFIGTTNAREFLADDTGNRRWLPVLVLRILVSQIATDRLQLWAEARELFGMLGVQWREAEKLAAVVHEHHMISDEWEAPIAAWLASPDETDLVSTGRPRSDFPVSVLDLLAGALKIEAKQITRAVEMRAARILSGMRWGRLRVRNDGKRTWLWFPPGKTVQDYFAALPGPTSDQ